MFISRIRCTEFSLNRGVENRTNRDYRFRTTVITEQEAYAIVERSGHTRTNPDATNTIIYQAVFPIKMQVARVTVIFKKGDRDDMGNYRPVSILPILSKALEKVILKRLNKFQQKHHLLIDAQYGFRKNQSTELALLTQKEYIFSQLEKGNLVLGLFIDYTKAFDHVNNELLIQKLERYGIRGGRCISY